MRSMFGDVGATIALTTNLSMHSLGRKLPFHSTSLQGSHTGRACGRAIRRTSPLISKSRRLVPLVMLQRHLLDWTCKTNLADEAVGRHTAGVKESCAAGRCAAHGLPRWRLSPGQSTPADCQAARPQLQTRRWYPAPAALLPPCRQDRATTVAAARMPQVNTGASKAPCTTKSARRGGHAFCIDGGRSAAAVTAVAPSSPLPGTTAAAAALSSVFSACRLATMSSSAAKRPFFFARNRLAASRFCASRRSSRSRTPAANALSGDTARGGDSCGSAARRGAVSGVAVPVASCTTLLHVWYDTTGIAPPVPTTWLCNRNSKSASTIRISRPNSTGPACLATGTACVGGVPGGCACLRRSPVARRRQAALVGTPRLL